MLAAYDDLPRVCALVLAAGRSARMGGDNKLLVMLEGKPLIAHAVDAALASAAAEVIVVTGHQAESLRAALPGRALRFVHNPQHQHGLSSSLRAGLQSLDDTTRGVMVCLADMPRVGSDTLDALIAAFVQSGGNEVCAPYYQGRRGNPVLWPARCFDAMRALSGDAGAKQLLKSEARRIRAVDVKHDGVLIDVDSNEALDELRGSQKAKPPG